MGAFMREASPSDRVRRQIYAKVSGASATANDSGGGKTSPLITLIALVCTESEEPFTAMDAKVAKLGGENQAEKI
jgi:hypothetical protein